MAMWHAGGDVWRGAMALAKYLEEDTPETFVVKRVIELGGGTGLLGLSLALAGSHEVHARCFAGGVPQPKFQNLNPKTYEGAQRRESCLQAEGCQERSLKARRDNLILKPSISDPGT